MDLGIVLLEKIVGFVYDKCSYKQSFRKPFIILFIRNIINWVFDVTEFVLLYASTEFSLTKNNSMFIFGTRWFTFICLIIYAVMILSILFLLYFAKDDESDSKEKNNNHEIHYFLLLKSASFIVDVSIFIHCAAINNSFESVVSVLPFLNKISSVQGTEQWVVWSLSLVSVIDVVLDAVEVFIELKRHLSQQGKISPK